MKDPNQKSTKILVTGAKGFVGKSLCAALQQQKLTVVKVVRCLDEAVDDINLIRIESIDADTNWSKALCNVKVIVHLAARVHIMDDNASDPTLEYRKVNVDGTLNLARQAATAGVKRFIFVSSIKVNGEYTQINEPFTETGAPNPQDAYGLSKLEGEQGLMLIAKQTGMELVIIRPPLVYGAGVKANFDIIIRLVKHGIPLPLGAVNNKRSFVYLENLVNLIHCCIKHPAAANQLFLVSDGCDLSTPELIQRIANALGVKPRLIPIPQSIIELLAKLMGKKNLSQRLCGNLQLDTSKARQLLNWEPPITVDEGLKKTVAGLRSKI